MITYSAKIRLGGLLTNEVRKDGLTAAEIILLRDIHGDDAVIDIVETGKAISAESGKLRTNEEERVRLNEFYNSKETSTAEDHSKKTARMRALFGHDASTLPAKLPGGPWPKASDGKPVRTVVPEPEADGV